MLCFDVSVICFNLIIIFSSLKLHVFSLSHLSVPSHQQTTTSHAVIFLRAEEPFLGLVHNEGPPGGAAAAGAGLF